MSQEASVAYSVIDSGLAIKGEIRSAGPLVVAGRIEGRVICEDTVAVAQEGTIEGEITAETVEIEGTVKANIEARGACRLAATARMMGEVRAATLAIAEGATFVGKVVVGEAESGAGEASAGSTGVSAEAGGVPEQAVVGARAEFGKGRVGTTDIPSILAARSVGRIIKAVH